MLIPHLHLHGQCREAIALYRSVFDAAVLTVLSETENGPVDHAEIVIHGQRVMLNDFHYSKSGGYQLVVTFESEAALRAAYAALAAGGETLTTLHAADYSPCVVRFTDRFDVRWAFMVQEDETV